MIREEDVSNKLTKIHEKRGKMCPMERHEAMRRKRRCV
jgi:hypothetical protein